MNSLQEQTKSFKELLIQNEEWLMNSILSYADKYDFTRYTSTLMEAWRVSIVGLSRSLIELMEQHTEPPEFHPEDDYSKDPASAFGLLEAKRHRSRGVNLAMFLALFKYYRQSYHDLLKKEANQFDNFEYFKYYIDRFFDRTEIAYCTEWAGLSSEKQIQELSRTNLEMTNEKNKYLTIFDSFGSPVAVIDKDGYVENMNLMAEKVFRKNVVPGGKYYQEHKKKERFQWIDKEIKKTIKSDIKELSFEKTFEEKGLIFDVKLARLHDVSQKFVGYTVLMNDITEIREAQKKILEAKEKQIEQEKIIIQQSKLAAMGEMIGSIAHQWRQPLNVLNVNIENLEFDYEEGEINKEFIDTFITEQTQTLQYMSKTIDDFRNFFKIDKEKVIFSVKDVIEKSLHIQSSLLQKYSIKVTLTGDDFNINGFESEFQQVVMNLLSNATDAILDNNQNNGLIKISLDNHRVKIEDNGGGISKDVIDRIFEPYYTTKEQGRGVGLGLYISKMIIEENMGGKMTAVNIDGGARFMIEMK